MKLQYYRFDCYLLSWYRLSRQHSWRQMSAALRSGAMLSKLRSRRCMVEGELYDNYVFDIILTSTYSEKPGLLMMIWGVFANFHRARTQPAGWLPRQEPHCVPPRGKRDKLWGGFAASQIMPLYNFMRFGSLKIARMTCLSCAKKVVGPFFYFLLRSTGGEEKLRALSSKSKKIKMPPASAHDEILRMRALLSGFNKKPTSSILLTQDGNSAWGRQGGASSCKE